jgi:hypothetical protein
MEERNLGRDQLPKCNKTWTNLKEIKPKDINFVSNKWVFITKPLPNGTIIHFKAMTYCKRIDISLLERLHCVEGLQFSLFTELCSGRDG